MKKLLFIFFLTGFITARAQYFTLIKDINPGAATSSICYLTNINNKLFFAANDGIHGMELWKSDGTSAGTVMVKDVNAGSPSSSIGYLTNVNGTLFFVASDGVAGTELWKSDGTEAGTVMVKDIRHGSMGSNPYGLINVNGTVYFGADDGVNGTELWKSDGTDAGTVMIKDINLASASGYPQSMANMNGVLFFAADNGVKGMELWKSDGTAAGTVLFKDIWVGSGDSYPYDLTVIGNNLFFAASTASSGTELWKTDGTPAGTSLLKDVWSGDSDGYPFDLLNVGGTLFFSADNGDNGIELWKSDGTSTGTILLKDIWPGQESGAVGNFSKFINKLIFTGNDGVNGYKTWQSDGTLSGTKIATGIADPGDGDLGEIMETDTKLFAAIRYDATGTELWGISYSVILPLNLLEFTGMLVKNDAVLNWKTGSELNTASFVIERSSNGNDFDPVGKVAAVNSNSGTHDYQFSDPGAKFLKSDMLYYRLKQIDADSRFIYSKIVAISIRNRAEISLYPNPAINEIRLSTGMHTTGNLQYRIFDNSGKIVLQDAKRSSGNNLSIDISKLAAGVYHLDVRSNEMNKVMQFVKRF